MHLVPLAVGLCPDLARLVQEFHTRQPFLWRKVDFSRKVVEMSHHRGEDLLHPRAGFGTTCVNHMLCEVWIIFWYRTHGCGQC